MKHYLYIIFLFYFIFSCVDKPKIKEELIKFKNKSIILPENMNLSMNGKDTIIEDIMECKIKLIVYTDSTGCLSCSVSKMHLWNDLLEYAKQYKNELKYFFIFAPNKDKKNNLQLTFMRNYFEYPIFIDSKGEFGRLNPHIQKNKAFHTFLLDENNKVILVGNPLHNKKVEKLFYKITQELLSK